MSTQIKNICNSLHELATVILKSWNDDRTVKEVYGWNCAALTRHDLAGLVTDLANQFEKLDTNDINENKLLKLEDIPRRLQLLRADTIPYIFNGNGAQAIPAFLDTMDWIRSLIPSTDWQIMQDNKALPRQLAKKLQTIQDDLESLIPDQQALEGQIKLIQDAAETIESLPATLKLLKQAQANINKLSNEATESSAKIADRVNAVNQSFESITNQRNEAEKLVLKCEEAYRITTTKGLAAAFDQRATRLGLSMWVWVIGLLLALGIGANFGTKRIELLSEVITPVDPQWGVILMHTMLSLLSVAAPLWFAWLATKQIGQRFRLAEDYGFKASVAKAYEGYRKEAARIDSAFEARLFASTLARLEEAPLRLVEDTSHGSPWHELISSKGFQKALDTVPELKETFIDISKKGIEKISSPKKTTQKKTIKDDLPNA